MCQQGGWDSPRTLSFAFLASLYPPPSLYPPSALYPHTNAPFPSLYPLCPLYPPRTCIWHPLPEGWREAFDPVTKHPYYYNPITHEKTWARPQVRPDSNSRPDAVTVTPLVPMQQPRSLQPSKRRSGALPAHAAAAAGSHASAPGAL